MILQVSSPIRRENLYPLFFFADLMFFELMSRDIYLFFLVLPKWFVN